MFGLVMPWTRAKLRREEERKRIDAEYKKQEDIWNAKREQNRADYNKALIARTGVIQLSDARLAQKDVLTKLAAVQATPRPGYVTDYTSNSDNGDLAMFAAQSFIDGLTAQNSSYRSADPSPSSDSGSSSSCDTGSSSDSGSCSSDSSSW